MPAGSVLQGVLLVSPRAPPTAREPEIERMAAAQLVNAARDAFSALSELPQRRTEDSQDGSLSEVGAGTRVWVAGCYLGCMRVLVLDPIPWPLKPDLETMHTGLACGLLLAHRGAWALWAGRV